MVTGDDALELNGIKDLVKAALLDEDARQVAAGLLGQRVLAGKCGLTEEELPRGVRFVRDYVRNVPHLMDEALGAANGTHAYDKLSRVLDAAAAYWFEEHDVIPDELGLVGLMDDAYCSMRLIEAVSRRFDRETGSPLIRQDLEPINTVMKRILGPTDSEILDEYVTDVLLDKSFAELLAEIVDDAEAPFPVDSLLNDDDLIGDLLGI